MIDPLEIPSIRDKIMEFVGPKHARTLRLVNHAWNKRAVAVLAANNWTVRVSPDNIDEYYNSDLLRPTPSHCEGARYKPARMKIALDFGKARTAEKFHRLLDTVTHKILDKDGPGCVSKLRFSEETLSLKLTEADWTKVRTFTELLAPGLRVLHLFGCNLPRAGFSFPNLVDMSYCLNMEHGTNFMLADWLQPAVLPQLSRLSITTISGDIDHLARSIHDKDTLGEVLPQLKQLWQLTELTLSVDPRASFWLNYVTLVPLSTVVTLRLYILRDDDRSFSGPDGTFISRLCPELRLLDLEYEPISEPELHYDASTWFPDSIGQLSSLQSLTYRKKDNRKHDGDSTADGAQLQHLRVMKPKLLRVKFPHLQSVSVQLDFELSSFGKLKPLQFPTVTRLEIQIPARAEGPTVFSSDVVQRLACSLHEMYPNISCIALDLKNVSTTSTIITIAKHLVNHVVSRPLDKFELLNCDLEPGAILSELIGNLKYIRRLRLTAATNSTANTKRTLTPARPRLSLIQLVSKLPQLQLFHLDERFGQFEIADLYKQLAELKLSSPNLTIDTIGFS